MKKTRAKTQNGIVTIEFLLCWRGSPSLRSNDIKNTQQKNFYGTVKNLKIEINRVLDITEDLNYLYYVSLKIKKMALL